MATGLKFDLADGRRWLIRPLDERAAAVVVELGRVMRLKPGATGRELLVAVPGGDDWYPAAGLETGGPVTCCVADPSNPDRLATGMDRVAFLVAMDALARGGLLLHAALAEHRGRGFLMAGPGTVGKSTASRRLPPPWSSLCDDTTLVVRDRAGRFWAHPWPTWSTFHIAGPADRSWEVERAVPLRAVFFISQAPADRLEPVTPTQATALTIESAVEVSREACRLADRRAARRLCDAAAGAARHLAA
ncbi:SynChlorMet cassette protein ScmC, partial [candidate division WOR-3 bacterium]|nr:SynChlorMet cassette protein ScmC [candidate division WOR-3 bacterium]